jgi:hypothetical protein
VLGSGVHSLSFSGVGTIDYKTLKVIGWQGDYSSTTGVSGTAGKFIINNALTTEFVNQFKFVDTNGLLYDAVQLGTNEMVAITKTLTGNANIRITTGATMNGTWSPELGSGTSYVFTPSANNVTINVADITSRLNSNYSNVTILTACNTCTQNGIVTIGTAINADANLGSTAYNKL